MSVSYYVSGGTQNMVKMILILGTMLLSLSTYAAGAGDGSNAADSANLLPAITDAQRWVVMNPSRVPESKVAPEEGALRVDVTKVKTEPARGDLSLGCMGVLAKAGKAYNLRFTAKASELRQISISAIEPSKPDESIVGQATTELKTTWQTYVCRIVPTRDCTPYTRIPSFEFGDKAGTIWFRNVTLVPADAGAAPPGPAPTAAAAPAGSSSGNLLPNAMSPDQWIVSQKGSATGTVEHQENQLRINVTTAAADRWSFRLQHRAIDAPPGHSLTLKFSAKASAPRKTTISSQQGLPPMGDLTEETVLDVGTEWKEYTCKFTFPKGSTASNDLFPIIELGDQTGTIWLRDIVLTGGDAQGAPASTPPGPRAGTPPNPTGTTAMSSIADMTKEGVWRIAWRGAQGSVHKEGGALQIAFTGLGQDYGIPALTYPRLQFPGAKGYRLKFSAKSSEPAQIKVVAQSDDALHERDFSTPVALSLTSEWHDYDMTLTVAKPADADVFTLSLLVSERKRNEISFRSMSLLPE